LVDSFQRDIHCLLGLPFDAIDMAGAEGRIRDAAIHRKRFFFSTPNLNFILACISDVEFRDSVLQSDLSIADGMPIVWMAWLLNIGIRERVAGSTLFEVLRKKSRPQMSVYFFGGPDGVAEKAAAQLVPEKGSLTCVGYQSPGFGSIEDMSVDTVVQRINASKADILIAALGARKGQAWIQRNRPRLEVPVVCHLGAVVNFVAGTVRRAPVWMQKTGLEWLWRVKEEPALYRRYLKDGMALASLLFTRVLPYACFLMVRKVDARELAAARLEELATGAKYRIRLYGAWTHANIAPLRDCFSRAAQAGTQVELELSEVTYVDSAFMGLLMILQGRQKQQGLTLRISAPSRKVRRIFEYNCAEFLLGAH
jgi:N-acetylglucosaminyldiphosphoundecaprenol N-acetyl-beta-D-mannosaminyltransferase